MIVRVSSPSTIELLISGAIPRSVMAVSKKGKRKVKVKGRHYIWYVKDTKVRVPEEGFVKYFKERYLHIISTDKKFIVHYRCPKPGDRSTVLRVEGPHFPRAPGAREIKMPRWRHDSKRYPTADFVRRLIGWCLNLDKT